MISTEIGELLRRDPFEPFRIKLDNGDTRDVFQPLTVALQRKTIMIASLDGYWFVFPIDKVCVIESLFEDFSGTLQGHGA